MSASRARTQVLAGRVAHCRCGRTAPSSLDLRGFEYQGPGSRSALEVCVCGYHVLAHHEEIRSGAVSPSLKTCPGFRPRGDPGYDLYWCGCEEPEH